MQAPATRHRVVWVAFAFGMALCGVGILLLVAPGLAERLYGLRAEGGARYTFHYVAGVRELYAGIVLALLALLRAYREVGILLLASAFIPAADFLIVVTTPGSDVWWAVLTHLAAIPVVLALGTYLLRASMQERE